MADYLHLSELINQHKEFQAILSSLRPGRLSEDKIAMIQALGPRVERFLGNDKIALEAWAEFMGAVREGYVFSFTPTPRQVLAATILAGAAIKKPELQLRPDLRPELYQERADLLKVDVSVPPLHPGGSPRLFKARTSIARDVTPRYGRITDLYDSLTKRMSIGGKLDNAIKTMLTDSSKSLAPLGAMRTLDNISIENAQKEVFGGKAKAWVNPIYPQAIRPTNAFAPKHMTLSLNRFLCVRQQEDEGSDQIFWGGSFIHCMNLAQVYAQIEEKLKQGNLYTSPFDVDFKWGLKSFVRPKGGNLYTTRSNGPWIEFGPDSIVFEQEFYKGFGPWSGVIFCVEDDDAEYKAVTDVIDSVGDYANAVGRTASTVSVAAAAGGVTGPAAIATGAVSTAAGVVSIGTHVVGAVVDIVNFFDSDDLIDSINLSGSGDYAVRDSRQILRGTKKSDPYDLIESPTAAHYQIEVATNYSGIDKFDRTWGCSVDPKCFPLDGGWFDKSGGLWGNSGDIERKVTYNPPVHLLEGRDVEQRESDPGSAYVKKGYPKLEANGTVGRIKVHWGVPAIRSFKFKIRLDAFRFERKL